MSSYKRKDTNDEVAAAVGLLAAYILSLVSGAYVIEYVVDLTAGADVMTYAQALGTAFVMSWLMK